MRACDNCYFFDKCKDEDKIDGRCEYYSPLFGEENIALNEYEEDLKVRVDTYQEIVDELNA